MSHNYDYCIRQELVINVVLKRVRSSNYGVRHFFKILAQRTLVQRHLHLFTSKGVLRSMETLAKFEEYDATHIGR